MIKQLMINGELLINIPAEKPVLLSLGMPDEEATIALNEHGVQKEMEAIRAFRAPLLLEADYLVNLALDNHVDVTAFRQYRQQLHDIPQTYQALKDVVWPQKPSLPQVSA